jgi:hypothetical protein
MAPTEVQCAPDKGAHRAELRHPGKQGPHFSQQDLAIDKILG